MDILNAAEFNALVNNDGLVGGDIVFTSFPTGTGRPHDLVIKAGQALFGRGDSYQEYGDVKPHQVVHGAIIVKEYNPTSGKMDTLLAEGRVPQTRIIPFSEFYQDPKRASCEYNIFRAADPVLRDTLHTTAYKYAKSNIPFPSNLEVAKMTWSKPEWQSPYSIPESVSCTSFVSLVVNHASYSSGRSQQIPYTKISPDYLYVLFRDMSGRDPTWQHSISVRQHKEQVLAQTSAYAHPTYSAPPQNPYPSAYPSTYSGAYQSAPQSSYPSGYPSAYPNAYPSSYQDDYPSSPQGFYRNYGSTYSTDDDELSRFDQIKEKFDHVKEDIQSFFHDRFDRSDFSIRDHFDHSRDDEGHGRFSEFKDSVHRFFSERIR